MATKTENAKAGKIGISFLDQVLTVGTMFLVNVYLARSQPKQDYGAFVLAYSIYAFLAGIYNALIIEPVSVFGAGKYRELFGQYSRLIWNTHLRLVVGLTITGLTAWGLLKMTAPNLATSTLFGLCLASGALFTAILVRRLFYVLEEPLPALAVSVVTLISVLAGLVSLYLAKAVTGRNAFLVLAAGSVLSLVIYGKKHGWSAKHDFLQSHPGYWQEHWRYSRWILATGFVFQLTSQGYYWLLGGLMSLTDLAEFRAAYNLVLPIDTVSASLSILLLPMMAKAFARQEHESMTRLVRQMVWISPVITISYVTMIWAIYPWLMRVLYGGKYSASPNLLLVMVLVPVVMAVGNAFNVGLKAAERSNLVFIAYLLSGSVTLLIGIPLVSRLGTMGAAFGLLLSAVTYSLTLVTGFYAVMPTHRSPGPQRAQ